MKTLDHQVIQTCRDWLSGGKQAWLCTILRTHGSSPRPVGSLLAFNADGFQAGSLSGGCVEDDLMERVRNGDLATQAPSVMEYGITAQDNERLGLPCGGRLEILVEPLNSRSDALEHIDALLAALRERRCILRKVEVTSGDFSLEKASTFSELDFDGAQLLHCFGPHMRMLLVGAGQLSQSLAELAQAMDYEVLVTDPRSEVLAQWRGPEVTLLGGMPDDVVREKITDPHSIVITLTHDPRIDDMALMEALTTKAWYVGALGSARTTEKRLQRLRDLDLTEQQIAALHAPVGLRIGSKTPVEIAVAIMAEVTQLQNL
ncbi:MAG: XdhC family protein [Halioglobus sp.]